MSNDNKQDMINTEVAVDAITSAMKRKKLKLFHMYRAVNILVDCAVEANILELRSKGWSIRKIARAVHMNDKRVALIIKDNAANAHKKPCDKPCDKPCKKQCKKQCKR